MDVTAVTADEQTVERRVQRGGAAQCSAVTAGRIATVSAPRGRQCQQQQSPQPCSNATATAVHTRRTITQPNGCQRLSAFPALSLPDLRKSDDCSKANAGSTDEYFESNDKNSRIKTREHYDGRGGEARTMKFAREEPRRAPRSRRASLQGQKELQFSMTMRAVDGSQMDNRASDAGEGRDRVEIERKGKRTRGKRSGEGGAA